jgi:hypothetical protein
MVHEQQHEAAAWPGFAVGRRGALALIGCGAMTAGLARPRPVLAEGGGPSDLRFDVYRKGARIGEHAVRFTPTAQGQLVASRIELAVKVAFITAYRYVQDGEDEWRQGVLVGTNIATDDDGSKTLVTAAARGDRLHVSGPAGEYDLDLGTMTDLNFWNEGITRQARLIDSQNGEPIKVAVTPDSVERMPMRGRMIEARRFAMSSTKGRSGTVWYDADGTLVKAVVYTRGERLDYQLAAA